MERVNSVLVLTQVYECLPEDELGGAGIGFALGYRDLGLVAGFLVVSLTQVSIGEEVVREPVFGIRQYGLLESGSRGWVILAFEGGSAEEGESLGAVRAPIRRGPQVSTGLGEFPLLKVQISQKKVQIRAGWRQLIGVVELLLRFFELSRLECRNGVLGLLPCFRRQQRVRHVEIDRFGIAVEHDVGASGAEGVRDFYFFMSAEIADGTHIHGVGSVREVGKDSQGRVSGGLPCGGLIVQVYEFQ